MRTVFPLFRLLALAAVLPSARGATWNTSNGQPMEGELSGVFGSIAVVTTSHGAGLISVSQLDDAGLARVADFLERAPTAQPAWSASTSPVAKALKGRLQVLKDGKLVKFDPGTRQEPEIYVVYFGAHWCPPCRAFSPKLAEAYPGLKEKAHDRFEVIYMSDDRSSAEQLGYATDLAMPWPVLRYSEIGSVPVVEKAAGPAIPDLVVLTRDGSLIFSSFHGTDYVGPDSVLADVGPLLDAMDPHSEGTRYVRHSLAVLQYVRAAHGGAQGPQPYMIALDPSHYQTLTARKLVAIIDIDARGHVAGIKADPLLPTALEYTFEQEAQKWLFLPVVANGQPKAAQVRLPLSF